MVFTGNRFVSDVSPDDNHNRCYTVYIHDKFHGINHTHKMELAGDKYNIHAIVMTTITKRRESSEPQQTMKGSRMKCYEHLLELASNPESAFNMFNDK